jgi:HD-like signal output (HDOD) protein
MAARLEKKVLALVDNMSTLPDTAARAMALTNDPGSKFADLARLIEGDAAIATGVLRYANSALYAGGAPALKLHQAVVRLGMFQCKNLIASIGMRSLFQRMAGDTQAKCEVLWHHGYVTAFLCRDLNRAYRLGFDGEEFSAGLLHDLGRILILLADPECFDRASAMDFNEDGHRLDQERKAIGIDHCALGGWFGEHSRLPQTLIDAMRLHHDPDLDDRKLILLVAAADHMANHLARGEDPGVYRPEENAPLTHLWSRWPEARRDRLRNEVASLMDDCAMAAASEQAAY